MKLPMTSAHALRIPALGVVMALGLGVASNGQSSGAAPGQIVPGGDETPALPVLPSTPLPILELVSARPFTVDLPWPTDWRADHAMVREGWIVLLRVPHGVAVPRQTAEPVLYAGATTVERIENRLDEDLVLAILPASPRSSAVPGDAAGAEDGMRPLAELTIWYGAPALPEAIDAADITREITLAEEAKLKSRPAAEVGRALARGGPALTVADRAALLDSAATMLPAAPGAGNAPAAPAAPPAPAPR